MMLQTSAIKAVAMLLSLSSVASAWPGWLPEAGALVARQDSTPTPTAKQTSSQSASGTQPQNTASITQTGSSTATGKPSGNSTRTQFDAQDPAGSVVMVTPATTAGTQLVKVGDWVTWGWNYTNLQAPPTAIDVLISCSQATRTWTLTQNMTYATKADFLWDSSNDRGTPYVVAEYTLIIYDSDSSISATAEPGYLAPYSGFKFGMYTGAAYTPLASGWRCVSCSGAMSGVDKGAWGVALMTSAITVMTFTWFVTGVGLAL
ncbi:hypothetical protein MCOR25_002353 [Pyricularia grisea]|uniref:DUF7137 domain-containing protein n=1 Tax=Pyricularia grisea TaxID=148305 RepID=A0A6P8ARS7_PYRGI|nr:uncharacterized protein PgNI_09814 [Pyricularia grisea]KAI6378109.1 hypothetical protein MCOR25_002353 [Pyricularia grisea]TLD04797.1 hypothetical protein PgNI_09814 [Pyricularia grisea]